MVVFGRENVMPADLILCNPNVLSGKENSVIDFVAQQQIQTAPENTSIWTVVLCTINYN